MKIEGKIEVSFSDPIALDAYERQANRQIEAMAGLAKAFAPGGAFTLGTYGARRQGKAVGFKLMTMHKFAVNVWSEEPRIKRHRKMIRRFIKTLRSLRMHEIATLWQNKIKDW